MALQLNDDIFTLSPRSQSFGQDMKSAGSLKALVITCTDFV